MHCEAYSALPGNFQKSRSSQPKLMFRRIYPNKVTFIHAQDKALMLSRLFVTLHILLWFRNRQFVTNDIRYKMAGIVKLIPHYLVIFKNRGVGNQNCCFEEFFRTSVFLLPQDKTSLLSRSFVTLHIFVWFRNRQFVTNDIHYKMAGIVKLIPHYLVLCKKRGVRNQN